MSKISNSQGTSREEMYPLIAIYQQEGDPEIQHKLVMFYKDLVEALAAKFAKGRDSIEDLTQVGMIGLLAALRRYDPSFQRNFESFAIPTIIGEIKRYIRDKTWSVHVPRRIKELGPKIKKAVDELTIQLQRSVQVADIAAHLRISEEEVLEAMEMGRSYHSLSVECEIEADGDGSTVTLLDLIGNEEAGYDRVEQEMLLSNVFYVLNEREKEVIHLTYYDNLSQKQAGELLGISQMHVSRIQRRALTKLREAIGADPHLFVERP